MIKSKGFLHLQQSAQLSKVNFKTILLSPQGPTSSSKPKPQEKKRRKLPFLNITCNEFLIGEEGPNFP